MTALAHYQRYSITIQLVIKIFLEFQYLAGLGIDIVFILIAAHVEGDLVNLSAVLIIKLDLLNEVDLISAEMCMLQCFLQSLVLCVIRVRPPYRDVKSTTIL